MNKYLIIDIDDCLVTSKVRSEDRNNKWGVDMFDIECVIALNEILKETDAELILSSDWKYQHTLTEIQEIFLFNKVIKYPISITPKHKTDALKLEGNRAEEIKEWLNLPNRNYKIDKFVIIDDYNLSEHFPNNFVHCKNAMQGLALEGLKEQAINILNGNCPFCDKIGYSTWYNEYSKEFDQEVCSYCEGTSYCRDKNAVDEFNRRRKKEEEEELPF